MSYWRFVALFILAVAACGACVLADEMVRTRKSRVLSAVWFLLLFLAVPLLGLELEYWNSSISWEYNLYGCAMYIACFGMLISKTVRLVLERTGKKKGMGRFFSGCRNRVIFTAAVTLLVVLYGTINSAVVTAKYESFTSPKLQNSYKIAFLSDLHYGTTQTKDTVRKVFGMVAEEEPDLLILGGDLTDEYTTKEQMLEFFELLGELAVPKVMVWGNHDLQSHYQYLGKKQYSEDEIRNAVTESGVILLEDEYLSLGEDLMLLGRNDWESPARKDMDGTDNPDPEALLLVADHRQYPETDLLKVGGDVQLSGHSHGGQYFPLQLIYSIAGANPLGWYRFGNSFILTMGGASGWGSPFRNEIHSSVYFITFSPEK